MAEWEVGEAEELPPAVSVDLRESLRTYWLDRVRQHTSDSYAGVRISKFPEDLRTYEHLLWAAGVDTVIELGTQFGGGALWFRDRLRTMFEYRRNAGFRVISIDIEMTSARAGIARADPDYAASITLLEADLCDPALPDRVAELIPPGSRCMVVEDSAHEYATTFAALTGFARFVPVGGYFIVEDGCVDIEEMRLTAEWPRGVLPALHDWLETSDGARFAVRRELERYGVSCHPEGFLQRMSAHEP
jgi:cephalosporin hydroxylase